MLRAWLRGLVSLFRGKSSLPHHDRLSILPKAIPSSITLPGVQNPGVTVRVHALDSIHAHDLGGEFGSIMDYVIGFAVIGLVAAGGHYWSQRHSSDPGVAPWYAPATPAGSQSGSPWSLSSPKPPPAKETRTPRASHATPGAARQPDAPPQAIHIVAVPYTDWARSTRFHGKVFMIITVSPDGVPVKLEPTARIPFDLEPGVRATLMQWRFRPARRGGQAVEGATVVEVPFR